MRVVMARSQFIRLTFRHFFPDLPNTRCNRRPSGQVVGRAFNVVPTLFDAVVTQIRYFEFRVIFSCSEVEAYVMKKSQCIIVHYYFGDDAVNEEFFALR